MISNGVQQRTGRAHFGNPSRIAELPPMTAYPSGYPTNRKKIGMSPVGLLSHQEGQGMTEPLLDGRKLRPKRMKIPKIPTGPIAKGSGPTAAQLAKYNQLAAHHKKEWHKHLQNGGSWSDFTGWVKRAANTVYRKVLVPAHDFIKKHKIISRTAKAGAAVIGHPIGKIAAGGVGAIADELGYGKRKRKSPAKRKPKKK